ncbi:MAG TPA: VWA domain-containing protein [Candidatus Eremiobacteraeota bacterium]|nr:VWA domain-containing protein [Candidatus Eremiobacteraeota bacterium]
MDIKCPNCGNSDNIDRNLKCQTCGSQLQFDEDTNTYILKLIDCPSCGHPNSSAANFCSKCREKLSTEEPVQVTVEEKKDDKSKKVLIGIFSTIVILLLILFTHRPGEKLEPIVSADLIANNNKLPVNSQSLIKPVPVKTTKPVAKTKGPRMDVVFCVDTTGSMGDEIDIIKSQLLTMVEEIQQGNPAPSVRFGVVAYKDRGDEYVTKDYPLIQDIKETQKIINSLTAKGGGDYPESVNEALHVAIDKMNWDKEQNVKKIIFLIGDASPHMDYPDDFDYKKEIAVATKKGIMINTISCSGMQDDGNQYFQEVANATNGNFEYLTYKYVYEDDNGKKQVVLNQAGVNYMVEDRYAEDESWKEGARDMAKSKKAKEYRPSSETGTASTYSSITGGGSSSAPPPPQVNNLDSIITQTLKNEAVKEGVIY